jgi:hypothetical protein
MVFAWRYVKGRPNRACSGRALSRARDDAYRAASDGGECLRLAIGPGCGPKGTTGAALGMRGGGAAIDD